MTIAFKTFGCRLNRAESLDLEARLSAGGHRIVSPDGAVAPDVILVRGCSVTARAQRDCEKEIAHLRRRFPCAQVVIGGCLPGAVDLSTVVPANFEGGQTPAISDATSRAYLKVQDGCSGKCAFCIVPQFRGKPRSVPFDSVMARARACLDAGYRELVVTGCNLALYRSAGRGLPELLAALAEMGSVPAHRVRLGSLEPGVCDDKLLETFAKHENICRFIHISLQSGSNNVLKRMNRPYPTETVARFREKAFALLGSSLSLGADVITGFPGETEADFAETCAFVESGPIAFTNLHVFPYSERPGTPAATMDGALPRAVRLERARLLESRGRQLRTEFAKSFIGRTVEVCAERGGDHGWTSEYLQCKLKAPAERRSLVKVVADRVENDVLFAR